MPADLVVAQYANTRGSRVNDPDLERYLRDEYPGGMTVEALLAGTGRPHGGGRRASLRLGGVAFGGPLRLKPSPAPHGPSGGAQRRKGAKEVAQGPGRPTHKPTDHASA